MNKFKIITTTWNADNYIARCINSVKNQTYKNWNMLIIDDVSTDSTKEIAIKTIANDPRIIYIRNEVNLGGLVNYLKYIPQLCTDDEDILCFLDGDDALFSNDVFEYLNTIYSNGDIWLTYGDFTMNGKTGGGTYWPLTDMKAIRARHEYNFTHLKTQKYGIFKKIKQEDFIDRRSGKIFDTVWDVIITIPVVEMSGFDRIKKIDKILYIYNNSNNNSTVRSGNTKSGSGFNHLLETNFFYRKNYPAYKRLENKNSESSYV